MVLEGFPPPAPPSEMGGGLILRGVGVAVAVVVVKRRVARIVVTVALITPRRMRGGVGAFSDDEVGVKCSGGWNNTELH